MQSIRRSLSFAGLSLMAMALTFAACTDDGQSPMGPEPLPPTQPPSQMVSIECRASIKSLGMSCQVPRASAGAASGVLLAEQNVDVKLASNDLTVTADTFAFDVNIQNIIPQPTSGQPQRLGVDSLGVLHPIQVGFTMGPLAPQGGSVDVANEDGMETFTAGNQPYFEYPVVLNAGQVTPDKRFKLRFSPGVDSLAFRLMVKAMVPRPTGWVDVSPDTTRLLVDSSATLAGVARNHAGRVVPGEPITWSSSNTAVATVSATGAVTAVATGTAVITASTPTPGRYGTAVVIVSNAPAVTPANYDAIENVTATVAAAQGLMTHVTDADNDARITPGTFATAAGGYVVVDATGAFLYIGKAGYSGPDSFNFTVTDNVTSISALANVTVAASSYWYVRAGASEAMNGTQASPFPTVAAAKAAAVGPDANDIILVQNAGATKLDEAVVLEAGQSLIGEGISAPITVDLNGAKDTILGNAGAPEITRTTAGATVTLSTDNVLQGLGITAANGPAIAGNGFGTLTVNNLGVHAAGPALHLTTGTLVASFSLLSSTGSAAQGLFLSGVDGTLAAAGGSLRNATGTAFAVAGGTANITYPGVITNPAGLAVSIANRTGGSITLADSISGNGEGISLTGNSGGTATFAGVLNLTRKGIFAQNNTGGTFSFTGTAKTIDLDSTTNTAVTLATNTGATFVFGGGNLAISTASGTGFSATGGGTVSVTGTGNTISTNTGTAVALDGVNTTSAAGNGVIFASVNTTAATTGISLNAITGAGFGVTGTGGAGTGGTLNTTGNGVLLTALGATPVELTNLNVVGTGAAAAFSASGSTGVTVASVAVNATGGPALSLASSTLNGTFSDLTSTASASSAVILNTAAGAFTAAAGTLSGGAAGPTVAVIGGSVDFIDFGTVSQAANAALLSVTAGHTGDLNFNGAVSATAGTGMQFTDADGAYLFNGTTTLAGGDAGVDVTGGSDGTFDFAATTSITNPTGVALNVAGGTPGLVYAGTISTNASRPVVVDGITADSVVVSGSITSTGNGILVQNNAAAAKVAFTGAKSLTTGANPGVSILTNASGVRFGGGNLNITTAGAIGFQVQGGGTVEVQGPDNTISTTGAAAASIQNTSSGTGGIVFRSISSSGAANALVINTVTGAGFQVTGNGTPASGGTLSATNTAVLASALDSLDLNRVVVSAPAAINATTFGGLRLDSATVTSTAGAALALTTGRLHVSDVAVSATSGAALATNGVALSGTLASLSATLATAGNGVSLVNSTGSLGAPSGTISVTGAGGTAVSVNGGSAGLVFGGNATQDANAALLAVAGGHTGTLVFNNGTLNANNGTGLQLTDGDGTYSFAGTLDLSGGDAGIDIAALSAGTVNVTPAGGHTASIVSPTGAAIAIGGGSGDLTFNGNVTQATAGQALLSVAGAHSGDVSFPTGTLTATNGTGLQFNDADGTYAFNGTTTLSNSVVGADAGIDVLGGSGGTFTFNANAAVTNPASQAINIQNGAGTLAFTYSGSFTKNNNAATGILVQNNAGGSIAFNGDRATETKVLSTTTAAAVSLANNGSTSIVFGGGGLDITTTSGAGFSATGSGTVQVTGAENTVAAGTGTAVNIQNVTVGASGVVFKSVSANGGANGIVLNTTGATGGGFGVTGDGATVGSGGTIQGTTGGDGAVSGNGVYLNATRNVNLAFMNFSGHGNHAIRGLEVTGVTLDRVRITGTNGSNVSGEGEGSVYFHGLYGSASITRSYIEGGVLDNVRVVNTSGTLDRLVMNNDTIGHNGNVGSDGVFLQADGSAVFKATVQNSRFTGSVGDQTQMSARGTSNVDFVYTGNVLSNNHPARLPQNFGVAISSGGSGAGYNPTLTYAVNNNVINDAGSTGISIGKGGVGAGSFTGTVNGNTIGTAGVGNSGSAQGSAIVVDIVGGGSHNSTINNNTIRQFTNYGILAQSGNATAGGGQGYLTLTIQGNNIAEPSPASAAALFPTSGIRVMTGTNAGDNHKNCVVLGGTLAAQKNTVTNTGTNGGMDLRLFQRFVTLLGVPGYAGANNDNAAMNAFLSARNTLSTVSGTNNTATPGPGFSGSCPA